MVNLGSLVSHANDLATTFKTGIDAVETDVMSYVGDALPVAIGIVGTFMAIRLGVKFFKGLAK